MYCPPKGNLWYSTEHIDRLKEHQINKNNNSYRSSIAAIINNISAQAGI